jgi:dUTP pyrophosphatase
MIERNRRLLAELEKGPELKVFREHPDAKLPVRATDGSACYDVCAINGGEIQPLYARTFMTGLKFAIPLGYVMLVFSRSGHGFKFATRLSNCVGVIDSDYRGELRVKLHNDNEHATITIDKGERIAQIMLVKLPELPLVEVGVEDDLGNTERGDGGFGSTGR